MAAQFHKTTHHFWWGFQQLISRTSSRGLSIATKRRFRPRAVVARSARNQIVSKAEEINRRLQPRHRPLLGLHLRAHNVLQKPHKLPRAVRRARNVLQSLIILRRASPRTSLRASPRVSTRASPRETPRASLAKAREKESID